MRRIFAALLCIAMILASCSGMAEKTVTVKTKAPILLFNTSGKILLKIPKDTEIVLLGYDESREMFPIIYNNQKAFAQGINLKIEENGSWRTIEKNDLVAIFSDKTSTDIIEDYTKQTTAKASTQIPNTANTIIINTATATDEELALAISELSSEQIKRAKLSIPPIGPAENGEIVFRGVPWYSSRKETETIIRNSSSRKGPTDIYRMSAIDYDNVTSGSDRVDDLGGCMAHYYNMNVAGWTPSSTYICYIYPIVDGIIIRDDNLAQMYFAYYKFSRGDFADHKALYDDLQHKLNNTYGQGRETVEDYHTWTRWYDASGNYIQLLVDNDYDYASLGYIASDADQRLDEMQIAIDAEKTAEEQQRIKKNQDNYEGL